jgi:prepilin-type N-terminal cleavage/methylation domain-containing protein
MKHFYIKIKGFTLIELVISVAIFAGITVLLLAKYGNFNQGILLTNLAYDVALTIRNAQSYGLNVQSAPMAGKSFSSEYNIPYGVYFRKTENEFTFFSDLNENGLYNNDLSEYISKSTMKRGARIDDVCVGTETSCDTRDSLNITFKRPNPDAVIKSNSDQITTYSYAKIKLLATDGSIKNVVVRSTGQIAVEN